MKAELIKSVRITIEPYRYKDPDHTALRIRLERLSGEDLYLEQVIPYDDLHSVWDYIWQRANDELKRAIEEDNK